MRIVLAVVLGASVLVTQVRAQETGEADRGLSLIERGAEMFLRGLLDDLGPELNAFGGSLEDAARALGPALGQLGTMVDDIGNYDTPERLPNGDILIRRKAGAPPPPDYAAPDKAAPLPAGPQIEL